jgi:uncharacterized membrane protein
MTDAVTQQNSLSEALLGTPYDQLNGLQKSVIDLICSEDPSSAPPALRMDDERTFWQRLADRVAAVGGSWTFIAWFGIILFGWIGGNLVLTLAHAAFDPYPFIFLNLMLSMLAAIQAPVIMMSQNRQSAKDRAAAEHDYVVNMRAELEIMHLHDKLDALRDREVVELIRVQGETLDLLRKQVGELSAKVQDGD